MRHGLVPTRAAGLPPHLGRRHRASFEALWGVGLDDEPGTCASRTCSDAAVEGTYKGMYVQGEDILQSDPDTKHVSAGLAALECLVVQDLF